MHGICERLKAGGQFWLCVFVLEYINGWGIYEARHEHTTSKHKYACYTNRPGLPRIARASVAYASSWTHKTIPHVCCIIIDAQQRYSHMMYLLQMLWCCSSVNPWLSCCSLSACAPYDTNGIGNLKVYSESCGTHPVTHPYIGNPNPRQHLCSWELIPVSQDNCTWTCFLEN